MKARSAEQRVKVAYRAARNTAQTERKAGDDEVKKIADTANVQGGETWGNASGHSGTRAAWYASGGVVAGFLLVAFGMTVGPRLLIWIGIGVIVLVGAFGMATHVWSDYEPEPILEADDPGRSVDPGERGDSAGAAGSISSSGSNSPSKRSA
jgi:hypothetical protein